jgi:hypothetical protein
MFLFAIISISFSYPKFALSMDIGIPDLIGTRIEKYFEGGYYLGIQPGFLVTLPTHFIYPDNPWLFTPGLFFGYNYFSRYKFEYTGEVDVSHPMSFNKYDKGGGILLTLRAGISFYNKSIFRALIGVTSQFVNTIGLPNKPTVIPSFIIQIGYPFQNSN